MQLGEATVTDFYRVELATKRDAAIALVIATVCGAIGGFVAELLIGRRKSQETGEFEKPRRAGRYYDFGSFAGFLYGAIAGVLAFYFFSPVEEVQRREAARRPSTTC
jgi:gas vesicle protein